MSKSKKDEKKPAWIKFYHSLFDDRSDVAMFVQIYFKTICDELVELCEDNEEMKQIIINYFNGEK